MVFYFYKTFYQNLHVLQGGFDLKKLTLIVPCFNEQEALPFFYKEAISVLKNLNYEYELLFINDGSKDNTLNRELPEKVTLKLPFSHQNSPKSNLFHPQNR